MITTKIKTAELIGNALDYIVAKLENHEWRNHWILEDQGFHSWNSYEMSFGNPTPKYSSDWTKGGLIIDREKIEIKYHDVCVAQIWYRDGWGADEIIAKGVGETSLIAAMRCYVARKLGDEVEIPLDLV